MRRGSSSNANLIRDVGEEDDIFFPGENEAEAGRGRRRGAGQGRRVDSSEPGDGYFETFNRSGELTNLRGTYLIPGLEAFQRGVRDTPVLRNLRNHPSIYLQAHDTSVPPRCRSPYRGAWGEAHRLVAQSHPMIRDWIEEAGFGAFLTIQPRRLSHDLARALAERWFSETNTFHLGDCELGVTPLDWAAITGLRFAGEPVACRHIGVVEMTIITGIPAESIQGHRVSASVLRGEPGLYTLGAHGHTLVFRHISTQAPEFPLSSCISWRLRSLGHFV